jgi:hypothetical protein
MIMEMKIKIIRLISILSALIISTFGLNSCEKDITVDLPSAEKKLVVDGAIFEGEFPYVALTYSFPFFEPLNFDVSDIAQLEKYLLLDAIVTVSDGFQTEYLTLRIDTTKFPPILYFGDTIKGEPGKTYTLKISGKGKSYSAVTTIPMTVQLDSINWKADGNLDSLGPGRLYFQDPPAYGNIYRLFCKRQGYRSYVPTFSPSTIDDQLYNGQYIEYPFYRPDAFSRAFGLQDSLTQQEKDERGYWKKGDSIYVKFCVIDRASFNYIRTYEQAASTSGNPFSNPTTVKSNIQGDAVTGGWCGYSVYKTAIIAK